MDFGPYLQRILQDVRENWYHLIPESAEMKKGKLAIEFAITKDGQVADMRLVASSGDTALDRPAWGAITGSNPFPASARANSRDPISRCASAFTTTLTKLTCSKSVRRIFYLSLGNRIVVSRFCVCSSKGGSPLPKMPVLFVGHGSPMNAIEHNAFTETLSDLERATATAEGGMRRVCALGHGWGRTC